MANEGVPLFLSDGSRRSPSDVAHDTIKGPYKAEDAIRPGEAIGEDDADTRDSGLTTGDPDDVQDTEAAVAAETRRRVEDMNERELDEAEMRDALAGDIVKNLDDEDPDKERLAAEIPNVGGDLEENTNSPEATTDSLAAADAQFEAAVEVAEAKGANGGENSATPVLEGDGEQAAEEAGIEHTADDKGTEDNGGDE